MRIYRAVRFVVGAFAVAFAYAPSAARAQQPTSDGAPPASTSETPPRPPYDIPPGALDAINEAASPDSTFPTRPPSASCPSGTVRTPVGCQRLDRGDPYGTGPATAPPAKPPASTSIAPPGTYSSDLTPFRTENPTEPAATTAPPPAKAAHLTKKPGGPHPGQRTDAGPDRSKPPPARPAPPAAPTPAAQATPQPPTPPSPSPWRDWRLYAAVAAGAAGALALAKLLMRPAPTRILQLRPMVGALITRLRFTRPRRGSLIAVRAVPQAIRVTAHAMGRPT